MFRDPTLRTTVQGPLGLLSGFFQCRGHAARELASPQEVPGGGLRGWDSLTGEVAQSGAEPQPPPSVSVGRDPALVLKVGLSEGEGTM